MVRLTKPQLLHVFENAIRESGWSFLYLSGGHPARYQVYRGDRNYRVRVYIWNLTPGGRNRPLDEWRIQATGVTRFEPEIGGKTLILGWWNDGAVFAGFDLTKHIGDLGSSASIQLREAALHKAVVNGFDAHNKGSGELAIAFRPDFLGTYIENLEGLHQCGQAGQEIEVLHQLAEDPNEVDDREIHQEIAEPRQYAIIATKRALREIDFRDRVLTAYRRRCAMCGLQLRLLDSAHILPAADSRSTDQTSNGVALCALHHRAYDRAFIAFDPNFRIHLNQAATAELRAADETEGLQAFRRALRPVLLLPADRKDRPDKIFVDAANRLRRWNL